MRLKNWQFLQDFGMCDNDQKSINTGDLGGNLKETEKVTH